jgi:hypothetical protein
MHSRRLSCLLLGAWLGCSLFMGAVAIFSFHSTKTLMDDAPPQMRLLTQRVGGDEAMTHILRYEVAEQNRQLFEIWELFQIVMGLFLFGFLLFGTAEGKMALALCLTMVVVVAAMHWLVTPHIVGLGRELDFQPLTASPLIRSQLQARHAVYSALELVKLLLGVILGALLVWPSSRKRQERKPREIDDMKPYAVR